MDTLIRGFGKGVHEGPGWLMFVKGVPGAGPLAGSRKKKKKKKPLSGREENKKKREPNEKRKKEKGEMK